MLVTRAEIALDFSFSDIIVALNDVVRKQVQH